MKKLTHRLVLALCLLFFNSQAQNYFNNRYDTFGSCDGTGMIDTINNSYLTAGFTCSPISYWALNLKLYNKNDGGVSLSKTYNWYNNNFSTADGIHKFGNKFLLCGSRFYKNDTSLVYQWIFDKNLDSFSIDADRNELIPIIKAAMKVSKDGFKIISSPWHSPPCMIFF